MKRKSFNVLRDKITPERRAKIDARVQVALLHLKFLELQKSSGNTEVDIEEKLNHFDATIAQLDRLDNISALSRYIQSMGGNLQLVAHFPEQEIVIAELGKTERENDTSL